MPKNSPYINDTSDYMIDNNTKFTILKKNLLKVVDINPQDFLCTKRLEKAFTREKNPQLH